MAKSRQTNFELLRILALVMVVMIHLATTGVKLLPITHINWFIATLFESLTRPAVHIFILLGGYFLGTRAVPPKQAIKRAGMLFIPVLIYAVVHYFSFVRPLSIATSYDFFLGFLGKDLSYDGTPWYGHLWFLYPYALLMILSPLLNSAIITLEKKDLRTLLLSMIVIFMIAPSINLIIGQKIFYFTGYPLPYFMTSYLAGGYIKRFGLNLSRIKLWGLYAGATLFTWGITIIHAHWLHPIQHKLKLGSLGSYDNMFVNEQIAVFLGAVALFGIFVKFKGPQSNLILTCGRAGFYAYTIHMLVLLGFRNLTDYNDLLLTSSWYGPISIGLVLVTTFCALGYGIVMDKLVGLTTKKG